jgi:glycolate oxidase FAD binding subunit
MTTADALEARLEALLGPGHVRVDTCTTASYRLGMECPTIVVQPQTGAQVAEVLALATRERLAVVPWGQGTQMHLGQLPARYDLALSLARLTRIVDYDAANLTLTAEAGVSVHEVYRLTLPQRQFLPLGFPGAMASLGGLLVTNTSGVKRLRHGGIRDLLLGLQVALPDGALVHFGGRVVKNVAGYDMNKLFIGSLGAFGVVVETTYRLVTLPEEDQCLAVAFPTLIQGLAAAAAVRAAALLPSAITLAQAAVAAAWVPTLPLEGHVSQVVLLVNYDGTTESVTRQIQESRTLCAMHGSLDATVLTGDALGTWWEHQNAWYTVPPTEDQMMLQVRLGVPPARLADALAQLATLPAGGVQESRWCADVGHGQVLARLPLEPMLSDTTVRTVQDWLHTLRIPLQVLQGYGVVEWAPPALRQQLDVWGESSGVLLLQRYKQRFDPHATINPGRFVAGL